jgi:RNA polymerase sigma-70 factor (ECF subfamily)
MLDQPAEEVLRRAQSGEHQAEHQVLTFLYPQIFKQLAFSFGFTPDLDDLTQEAMIQIHRALPQFEHRASLRCWSLKIAFRTALKKVKKRRLDPATLTESGELPEVVLGDEQQRIEIVRLQSMLQKLPPKQRDAIVLMEILGFTAKEAARTLGTFASTVQSRCRLARNTLERLQAEEIAAEKKDARQ